MLFVAGCRSVLRYSRAYSSCLYRSQPFKPPFQQVRNVRTFKLLGEGEAAHGYLYKAVISVLAIFYVGGAIRYVILRKKEGSAEQRRFDIAKEYYLIGHKRRAGRLFLDFANDLRKELELYRKFAKAERVEFAVHVADMTATTLLELGTYNECEQFLREFLCTLHFKLELPETHLYCIGLTLQMCQLYADTLKADMANAGFDLCIRNAKILVEKEKDKRSYAMLGIALEKAGRYHMSVSNSAKAKAYIQESLTLARDVLGPEDPNVVGLLNDLSTVCEACGQYDESIQLAREGLQLADKLGDVVSEERIALQHNLGLVMLHSGDRKGGRKHIETALEAAKSQEDAYSVNMISNNLKKIQKEDDELRKGGWLTALK